MKIYRSGWAANHGERHIALEDLSFEWHTAAENLQAKSSGGVYDFATDARHRYRVALELSEVASLMEALASSIAEIEGSQVRDILRPMVPDLLKIANAASNT